MTISTSTAPVFMEGKQSAVFVPSLLGLVVRGNNCFTEVDKDRWVTLFTSQIERWIKERKQERKKALRESARNDYYNLFNPNLMVWRTGWCILKEIRYIINGAVYFLEEHAIFVEY